jgi:uncharacterized protein (DUF2225 family)
MQMCYKFPNESIDMTRTVYVCGLTSPHATAYLARIIWSIYGKRRQQEIARQQLAFVKDGNIVCKGRDDEEKRNQ